MAVKTRAQIQTELDATLINTAAAGSITPLVLKGLLQDIFDSAVSIPTDTNLQGLYKYDATRQYYQNELTFYNGVWYTANANTVIGAFDPTKWDATTTNLYKASLTIATADVLLLNGTPKVIVPAVTGKKIAVVNAFLTVTYNSVAYATNTQLTLITDTATITQCDFLTGLNATGTRTSQGRLNTAAIGASETQLIASKDLKVSVASGNPTAGNSSITVDVFYMLL